MAASIHNALIFLEICECFWKNDPLMVKFSKLCSESFHRDTDRRVMFKFRDIGLTVAEIVRCLPDKKQQNFPSRCY